MHLDWWACWEVLCTQWESSTCNIFVAVWNGSKHIVFSFQKSKIILCCKSDVMWTVPECLLMSLSQHVLWLTGGKTIICIFSGKQYSHLFYWLFSSLIFNVVQCTQSGSWLCGSKSDTLLILSWDYNIRSQQYLQFIMVPTYIVHFV
jgi:hypothetical protein